MLSYLAHYFVCMLFLLRGSEALTSEHVYVLAALGPMPCSTGALEMQFPLLRSTH